MGSIGIGKIIYSMMALGWMDFFMVMEHLKLLNINMKVTFLMVVSMVKENWFLRNQELNFKVNLLMINLKVLSGQVSQWKRKMSSSYTMVNGATVKWMELGFLLVGSKTLRK